MAKKIRNRLRRYSLISIINVGLNHLTQQHDNKEKALRAMPWLPALVMKLAIEDEMISMHGDLCPSAEFDACCNAIWNAKRGLDESVQVALLGVRALMHAQFIFQRSETFGFLRWAALISRIDASHPCRSLFERVFSMTPDDFMMAAILLISQFKKEAPQQPIDLRDYSALPEELTKPLYQLVRLLSKDLSELRVQLQGELRSRLDSKTKRSARQESERHEFPWLAKYPLLKLDQTRVLAWNPTIFFHGLEEFVHIRLSEFGQDYTDSFSQVFEDYVIELIQESGTHAITDQEFKCLGNKGMSAVDALIPHAEGNVFIECKMSLFADAVLLSDHPPFVSEKLKRIRKAIVQGWKVGDLLRSDKIKLSDAKSADNDYLIVVTSRQLLFGNGLHLKQMVDEQFFDHIFPESNFMSPSKEQLSRMPPQNITILSIEEFEHLVGAVKSKKVTYLSFVQQLSKNASNPKTAKMVADQEIRKYVDKWYIPNLLTNSRDRVVAQLNAVFNCRDRIKSRTYK
ncbi:GapS1 family protein [Nitrosomonas europaea]|uniref:GapS1 family protein n=1 Tax=Nitrosomonas europaea TaxID=915 RepID=UPI000792DDE2|nr:hypothetical protein [Nitrosomonas europaea]KXK40686.1 MAG: hypothetical protein UZ02_AOB001001895 [Nitrosomonas europaea]HRN82455.1 hypothetical protein [Nitrosomonas europaea]